MRLFTAISLPENFVDGFEQLKSNIEFGRNLNWTKPENLHITTCFIGETEKNLVDSITDKLKLLADSTPEFELEFRNIQLAPPKKKPYMIWANYTTNDTYSDLCNKLYIELINLQKRTHYPHITLARFKGFLKMNRNQLQPNFPTLKVSHIGLWKSELTNSGPIYEKLKDFPLNG